ncbi:MAG: adenosine deaminase [Sphaerochaetaceae bacterium]|jgi:adenosine deaminase
MITNQMIQQLPKVELHTHLDGGLRLSTIIELAHKENIALPSQDETSLKKWFDRAREQKSLPLYLEAFDLTVSLLQTKEALKRVAFELMEDLLKDSVVYAEIRFAPILHTHKGLEMSEVIEAVLSGLEEGKRRTLVEFGLILCAMRNQSSELSLEVAKLTVAYRTKGVVGFDLAGDEAGHPPKDHLQAFQYIRNQNCNITVHAGEGFGLESIWQAIQVAGAHRIGHGTRLKEDMVTQGLMIEKMGTLSHYIRDKRIPIEMCLTSNIDTGATESYETHPFALLYKHSFRVFLCTDNRLMSDTSLTHEMSLAVKHYGFTLRDLEKITVNAMKSAFIHYDRRLRIIFDVIKRGYSDRRSEWGLSD